MKLPTVPTVYYCPEINEIVLITPYNEALPCGDIVTRTYRIEFDDCCHDYFEDKSYLKKNWPHLVKIGEL